MPTARRKPQPLTIPSPRSPASSLPTTATPSTTTRDPEVVRGEILALLEGPFLFDYDELSPITPPANDDHCKRQPQAATSRKRAAEGADTNDTSKRRKKAAVPESKPKPRSKRETRAPTVQETSAQPPLRRSPRIAELQRKAEANARTQAKEEMMANKGSNKSRIRKDNKSRTGGNDKSSEGRDTKSRRGRDNKSRRERDRDDVVPTIERSPSL